MRRNRILVGGALVVLLALAGCGGSSDDQARSSTTVAASDATAKPAKITTITQPLLGTSILYFPAVGASDLGLFEKYGVKLNMVQVASNNATPLYLSGQVKFGTLSPSVVASIAANDRPINVYGVGANKLGYYFFVRPGIKELADLKGKVIGISAPGGQPDQAARELFKEQGVSTDGITFQPLGSVQNIVKAMIAGQVDAGAFGAPDDATARNEGLTELFDLSELDFFTPSLPVGGDPAWVAQNPEVAEGYMKGLLEFVWVIKTDPEQALESAGTFLNLDVTKPAERDQVLASIKDEAHHLRPPAEWGRNDDLYPLFQQALTGSEQKIRDPQALKPAEDLVKKLDDEGFFDDLRSKYGPLPTDD
jgi:NitT/TauT family transport system substrate-binding protein